VGNIDRRKRTVRMDEHLRSELRGREIRSPISSEKNVLRRAGITSCNASVGRNPTRRTVRLQFFVAYVRQGAAPEPT
jgi:hypothetical protein